MGKWFRNLKISQKLMLIGIFFILPDSVMLYFFITGINENIHFARLEQNGNEYQRPLETLLELIPQHARLVDHVLSGTTTTKVLAAKQAEIDTAFASLKEVDERLGVALQFTDEGLAKHKREKYRVDIVRNDWTELKNGFSQIKPDVCATRHRHLVTSILMMIKHSGDFSNLILDPDLDSYYLMDATLLALPEMQDRIADLMTKAEVALKGGKLSQRDQFQLASAARLLKESDLDRIISSVQTALTEDGNFYGQSPSFQTRVPPALNEFSKAALSFINLIGKLDEPLSTVLTPEAELKPEDYIAAGTQARTASFNLWRIADEELDILLQRRIDAYCQRRTNSLIVALCAFLAAVVFVTFITKSVNAPLIQQTAQLTLANDALKIEVHERKRVENELIEKSHLLSASQRIARIGSWRLDFATQNLTWTDETYELYKVSRASFVPSIEKLVSLIHPEDRHVIKAQNDALALGKECRPQEIRIPLPDGSIRTLVRWGETIFDSEKRPTSALGTVQDITERKNLERERIKIEQQFHQSQKMDAVGRLAGGVAHDFNNQLAVMMGYADLLKNGLQDPKMKTYVERIKNSVQRSADLTKNLLAFARKGQMQSTHINIHRLIVETISMLERTIDKRIVFKQRFDARVDLIMGDPSQIQNAFLNLAVNARDAMPDGGELIFSTMNLECNAAFVAANGDELQVGNYISIGVRDTGIGMTDEVKRHLFEPFFTTKEIGKGTGLGLASIYGTVKNHNGIVQVSSEVGHGTQFTILLPTSTQVNLNRDGEEEDWKSKVIASGLKGKWLLLVEDELLLRDMYSALFQSWGMECLIAENGRKAVELYKEQGHKIDLVIMDMLMPEMNGTDAFQLLKQCNPGIKVILATGFSLNKEIQALLDAGAVDFIQKPFKESLLAEKVMAALLKK